MPPCVCIIALFTAWRQQVIQPGGLSQPGGWVLGGRALRLGGWGGPPCRSAAPQPPMTAVQAAQDLIGLLQWGSKPQQPICSCGGCVLPGAAGGHQG